MGIEDHIESWLSSWGFRGNPFGKWEAGSEPWLEQYYIRRPFYEQLLTGRKSALIFAPRGGGKSATRIMIQSECRPAVQHHSILTIDFTDFSEFTESPIAPRTLSLNDYLPSVLRQGARRLLEATSDLVLEKANFSTADFATLRYWTEEYAPDFLKTGYLSQFLAWRSPESSRFQLEQLAAMASSGTTRLPVGNRKLGALIELWRRLVSVKAQRPPGISGSPSQKMQAFVRFAVGLLSLGRAPCECVYLLVDGVDEYDITQDDPSATAKMLRPLIGNLHFLELEKFAVKFFLPIEQRRELEKIARTDRMDSYTLSWPGATEVGQDADMKQLLRKRINAYGGHSLGELCAPELRHWIEDELVEQGGDSPRKVLRLGQQLFAEHCRDNPEPESEIRLVDWERAIRQFRSHEDSASEPREPVEQEVHEASHGDVPQLRVDLKAKRVYRGSDEILPPPTGSEYRLIEFLYRRRGQICSREEIATAVYGVGRDVDKLTLHDGLSDERIGTLVYRLRRRLEPSTSKKPLYIETVAGRGYCLKNAA